MTIFILNIVTAVLNIAAVIVLLSTNRTNSETVRMIREENERRWRP